jgi:putative nucleotidyltransferase with HDIG domain
MRERLLQIVPEFNMIQNPELREKSIRTWEVAMQRGGWTPDTLLEMPFTLLINPCPANFIEHVRAVTLTAYRTALLFGEIYGPRTPIHLDYLLSGGLLHDIGKVLEYEHKAENTAAQTSYGALVRHPFSGAALAYEMGLPGEVQHIIASHAGEGDKIQRSPEATLVNKADFASFETLRDLQIKKSPSAKLG